MTQASALSGNLRGILFMVAAMASFVINDTFMKVAMDGLPPYQVLTIRSVFALLWGIPLLAITGTFGQIRHVVDKGVLLRSVVEVVAVLGFILGLANVSIADMTAISQLAPILVMFGAAVFMRSRIAWWQTVLASIAFAGAIMVAQPGGEGFSPYALFGLWNAVLVAARELVGRTVPAHISGVIVAIGAGLAVLVGAGAAMLIFETIQVPSATELTLLAASGLFLMGGHFCVFMAFRNGEPGTVAPFFYVSTIWAVLSAGFVFGAFPNTIAMAGIALITISGVVLASVSEGQRRGTQWIGKRRKLG